MPRQPCVVSQSRYDANSMSKQVPQQVFGLKGGTKIFNPKGQALKGKAAKIHKQVMKNI